MAQAATTPSLNLTLHPRQAEVLTTPAQEILYGGAAGGGKAAQLITEIPTPTGWTTMGAVKVGDQVFDERGRVCNVVAMTEVMHGRPCMEVTFSDGTKVVVDEEHEWLTSTVASRMGETKARKRKENLAAGLNSKGTGEIEVSHQVRDQTYKTVKESVITTKEIFDTLMHRGRVNHSVKVAGIVRWEHKSLPIDPYLLGFWLGDGKSNNGDVIISTDDRQVEEILRRRGHVIFDVSPKSFNHDPKKKNVRDFRIEGLKESLSAFGLIGDNPKDSPRKHVPDLYMMASCDQRLALLQGLMDSDGCCAKDKQECSFSNINRRLIDQVYELACSLGIKARIRHHNKKGWSEKHQYMKSNSWEVQFVTDLSVFQQDRKLANLPKQVRETGKHRYILDVQRVPSVPVKCIQVDSPSNLYLITRSFIPTHNSFLLRAAAILWCCQIPGLRVFLFRRTFPDLESNHISCNNSLPELLGPLLTTGFCNWNKGKNVFEFWNGSSITLCHCQHEKDRYNYQGAEIHVLLIDELAHFTPVIYRYLRGRVRMVGVPIPTGVAGTFPKILCASNPGGPMHNYMRLSFVRRAEPMKLFKAPRDDGGMIRQFIPAKMKDNPSLLKDDPNYMERLEGLGDPSLVKAYRDGDFDAVLGGAFDDLWSAKVHVLRPFVIPRSWYCDRAFDWGSSKPFSLGWFAESDGTEAIMPDGKRRFFPRGTLIQIGEWYGWNGNSNEGLRLTSVEIADGIKVREKAVPSLRFKPGPADSQIFEGTNGHCIADEMRREGILWYEADKRPGSRIAGWDAMRRRMDAAVRHPNELPGMYVFSNCIHTIRTLPVATRDPRNPDDVDTAIEDHALDMWRYRTLHTKPRAMSSSIRAF